MSTYTRLLNLLEADRKAAVSKAGFALGKESIEEAQELASKEADIQKAIRRIERENRKRFGDEKIDALKIRHADWKKARKAGTLDKWRKKYGVS